MHEVYTASNLDPSKPGTAMSLQIPFAHSKFLVPSARPHFCISWITHIRIWRHYSLYIHTQLNTLHTHTRSNTSHIAVT